MMEKVQLKLCMGTMCYVMGGGQLRSAAEAFPAEIREQVEITYSPCLGHCNDKCEPPYIELNGKVIARVSAAGLIRIVKEEIDKNALR